MTAEHDLLTTQPTTHDTLAHELNAFDRIWDVLFPAKQARLPRLVVERVTVMSDGIDLVVRTDGVASGTRQSSAPGPTRWPRAFRS